MGIRAIIGGMDLSFRQFLRFLPGYLVGILLFLVLLPLFFYRIALIPVPPFNIPLCPTAGLCPVLSLPIFLVAFFFMGWSNLYLLVRGHGGPTEFAGVEVSPKTKHLVVDGPYRYSRNPMVFGANGIYFAITLWTNSAGSLLIWLIFYTIFVRIVIGQEEKRLEKEFGSDYQEYRRKTPMVLPFLTLARKNLTKGP